MVDLSSAKAGETVFYLTERNVRAPNHVEVIRISPRAIKVKLEPVITKRVEVVAEVVGKPAGGVVLKGVEVDPTTVTVEGAKSLVDQLHKVSTGPIDLNGAHKTFSQEVSLKLLGKEVRVVDRGVVVVRVILEKGQ
jgi:YbbR domain-containing protein